MTPLRIFFVVVLIAGLVGFGPTPPGNAQRGYGMHDRMHGGDDYRYQRGEGWNYCPYCGNGLNRRGGRGMGPYMMDRYHSRPYDNPDSWYYHRNQEPLQAEDARDIVQDMLVRSRNPNLKIGETEEKEGFFEVEILTQQGALVDKMQVHKETGLLRSIY
jgi:hypothetical protein